MSNETLREALTKLFFQVDYTCNVCEKEIFNGNYFCDDCLATLPEIKLSKCDHCGRITNYAVNYCNSCIESNINFDKALSFETAPVLQAFPSEMKSEVLKFIANIGNYLATQISQK